MRVIKDVIAGLLLFALLAVVCHQFVNELDRCAIEAQQGRVLPAVYVVEGR